MTMKARIVLQDLKVAISLHSDELQSEKFRISWLSITTLLRAIGHVLAKVDSLESLARKQAIDEKWDEIRATKSEPKIFWEFIEDERNRFLKTYEHEVSRTLTVPTINNTQIIDDLGNGRGGEISSPEGSLNSVISSGEFKGRNDKELALEAYDWWAEYLDDIDERTEKYTSQSDGVRLT